MRISRYFLLLMLGIGVCGPSYLNALQTDPGALLSEADDVIKGVVRVRGLDFQPHVEKSVKDRIEIAAYIREQIREEYSREDLPQEGRMLRALGLLPDEIHYEESILKLLSEPVESRYDLRKGVLYVASWLPGREQRSVLAHEATRALQDQNFNIEKILQADLAGRNKDLILAHQALLEGDRTVVMLQMALEQDQRHFSDLPDLAYVMQTWMATTQNQDDVSANTPSYLEKTLLFPYGHGASFLQDVWKNSPGWESINKIYLDLPVSTEQILHPEKYYGARDNPKPVVPMDPIARLGRSWRIAYQNVLGEFSLGLLLNLHFTEEYSAKVVSGWGGDTVMYLEKEAGHDAVFVNTIWDTGEDAEEFFLAMDAWFWKRFPESKRENESASGFSVIHDGRFYDISREGANLNFIFGLSEADGGKWLGK